MSFTNAELEQIERSLERDDDVHPNAADAFNYLRAKINYQQTQINRLTIELSEANARTDRAIDAGFAAIKEPRPSLGVKE